MASTMSRERVVVAGLGDVGILTAIRLSRHAGVVGISVKPALVSGQELGVRLSRPDDWARDYWISFDRFRRLGRVRIVHGTLTGLDLAGRTVFGRRDDGTAFVEGYDAPGHLHRSVQWVLAPGNRAVGRRDRRRSACCARAGGCRAIGDHRRRRRGGGQQRCQYGNHLAGQAN
jgi:hypothetical protein